MKQEVETSIMKLPAKNSKDFLLLSEAVRKKKQKNQKQTLLQSLWWGYGQWTHSVQTSQLQNVKEDICCIKPSDLW